MANKVLSIKMDEKDIQKLNDYYEALSKAGILSKKDFSKNAFYKHMLLDHIGDDIKDAAYAYDKCFGALYLMDDEDLKNMKSTNPYGLSKKNLAVMNECYADVMKKRRQDLIEAVAFFEKHGNVESHLAAGGWPQIYILPDDQDDEMTYWLDKMLENEQKFDENFSKNEFEDTISMIEKSNISEEDKAELIKELKEKHVTRKEFVRKLYGIN